MTEKGILSSAGRFWKTYSVKVIWLIVFICVLLPLVNPLGLPISISPETRIMYDLVEESPPDTVVWFEITMGIREIPSLAGGISAMISHMFQKDIKIVFYCSAAIQQIVLTSTIWPTVHTFEATYGEDYVILPYVPGGVVAVAALAADMRSVCPIDIYGTPLDDIPLMATGGKDGGPINDHTSIDWLVCQEGAHYSYIPQWKIPYDVDICYFGTKIYTPAIYPQYSAGLVLTIIEGMRGGAEYELLSGFYGPSVKQLDVQSLTHTLVISLIVIGNISYFSKRMKEGK